MVRKKVFFFIFSETACISSNHSWYYETITCSAPYSALQLSPRQLGILPLFCWKYATLRSVPFRRTQWQPSDCIFMHPNEHTSTIQLFKLHKTVHRNKNFIVKQVFQVKKLLAVFNCRKPLNATHIYTAVAHIHSYMCVHMCTPTHTHTHPPTHTTHAHACNTHEHTHQIHTHMQAMHIYIAS